MPDKPAPEAKATIASLSERLLAELAIHHHYFITTESLRQLQLPVPGTERYWRMVDAHNMTMLAITLCKVMELHGKFRVHFPADLLVVLDRINSRLTAANIQEFRNKFAGHILDNKTGLPLTGEQLNEYVSKLLNGQSLDEFRHWWWRARGRPPLASVTGVLEQLSLYARDLPREV